MKTNLFFNVLLSIFAMLISAATATAQHRLQGEWSLSELNGRPVANSRAYISFDGRAARVNGNAGCNMFSGAAAVNGNRIAFTRLATTKMFCAGRAASRLETEFLAAAARVNRFTVTAGSLNLYSRNRLVMKLIRGGKPSAGGPTGGIAQLPGKWLLEKIGTRPIRPGAFVNFDASKQSAGGNTGCNAFGGSYTATGNSIDVSDTISTQMACEQGDRMLNEREFLDALNDADRFAVNGDVLMLYRGAKALLELRRAP